MKVDGLNEEALGESLTALAVELVRDMLNSTGQVGPVMVAVNFDEGKASTLWLMNISEVLQLGDAGRDQIRWAAGKLCTDRGCDLSSMGVKPEHCKSDATLVMVEGTGTINDGEEIRLGTVEFFGVGAARTLLLKIEGGEGKTTVSSLGWAVCVNDEGSDGGATLH